MKLTLSLSSICILVGLLSVDAVTPSHIVKLKATNFKNVTGKQVGNFQYIILLLTCEFDRF